MFSSVWLDCLLALCPSAEAALRVTAVALGCDQMHDGLMITAIQLWLLQSSNGM